MDINVSFSARLGRREELRAYRAQLASHGYQVVSSWLDSEVDDADVDEETLGDRQQRNLEDIDTSTLHVAFSEPPGREVKGATRGARHFDAGYAYSIARVAVVGPRENGAHCEALCDRYETWEAFFEDLTGLDPKVDDDLGLDRSEP
jgi:hypothetical protein